MALKQWLLDYANERRMQNALDNPALDLDAPLIVPGLVWENPNRHLHGWQPPEYVAPPDPRQDWRTQHTLALQGEILARIERGLIEQARAALKASQAAWADVHQLEAQQRADEADVSEAAALRVLILPRRIETARKAAQEAAAQADQALGALRGALVEAFDATVRDREYQIARAQDEQADTLQQQAGDRRLAVVNARTRLEAFLPPPSDSDQAAAPMKRRGLFG